MVSFQGFDDNLNYHQFVKAGTVNGRFMWTRRLVGDKFKGPPTKTFEEATEFYKETIDAVKGAYEFFCRISELIKLLEQETHVVSSTRHHHPNIINPNNNLIMR